MLIEIPPKHTVASVIGFLKGKSVLSLLNFTGEHFWARGYATSTVGFEQEVIRKYIREQEGADKQQTPGSF